ncbi:MAG: hypothetical protein JXR48_14840 [Candidatus Delongbacteria bacterium]|nr:hypothetical protein [Candidatus Delongbacteria bacterium]MBN2836233.1 hypothetical protein [Candidatus Delongbacteria bacterium]
MIRILYNLIVIPFLMIGALLASVFSKKVHQAFIDRRGTVKRIEKEIAKLSPFKKTVLFHASSMGEFKQILPVIERFADEKEKFNLVVSVFSPSAYRNLNKKDLEIIDIITYIPFDYYWDTVNFINFINPSLVLISKHDVWPNFVLEIKKRDIPCYLVNALYANDTKMGMWYVKPFFVSLFKNFTGIITIDKVNRDNFYRIFPYDEKLFICGDSRFDTVKKDAQKYKSSNEYSYLDFSKHIFIAGSTWQPCEELLIKVWKKIKERYHDAFLVLVPHEVNVEHIYKIEATCQEHELQYQVYTETNNYSNLKNKDLLIVDKVGMLASLYSKASIAYVGGGFGKAGLHSVLEPAAYSLPVLFGPNLDKSPEAKDMVSLGCGLTIDDDSGLIEIVKSLWGNKVYYNQVCQLSNTFIEKRTGATEKIFDIVTGSLEKV